MSNIELFAALLGLVSVYLMTKQHILTFPTGIAMVILYIFVFYNAKLYSDMLLQVFFALMQLYGWYHWLHGKKQDEKDEQIAVSRLSSQQWYLYGIGIAGLTTLLGYSMYSQTDASLPYIDAFTTALSVSAQIMLTGKKIENWLLWIIADIIYVAMYAYKMLYPTALLYGIFMCLAAQGYREWSKKQGQVTNGGLA